MDEEGKEDEEEEDDDDDDEDVIEQEECTQTLLKFNQEEHKIDQVEKFQRERNQAKADLKKVGEF